MILEYLHTHGLNLALLADGRIEVKPASALTDDHRAYIRQYRDEIRGELVGAGLYVPGTLDAIYGFGQRLEAIEFTKRLDAVLSREPEIM